MSNENPADPLEFMRRMWGNMGFGVPGLVTPTLDVGELEKRIADLRAVEGWLKMNLSMLQASIQGLEVQRATLAAVKAMQSPEGAEGMAAMNPFANPALWSWPFNAAPADAATATDDSPPPDESQPDDQPPEDKAPAARKGRRA